MPLLTNGMEVLAKLFGSAARVKLLRLFLFNPKSAFTLKTAADRTRTFTTVARREISLFEKAGIVKRKSGRGKGGPSFSLIDDAAYLTPLQNLFSSVPVRSKDVAKLIRKTGDVKLIVVAGLFIGDTDGCVDVLVVGDKIRGKRLANVMHSVETDLGKEIRYTLLSTQNFKYRLGLYDKLMRDIVDYPHQVIYDRLHVSLTP